MKSVIVLAAFLAACGDDAAPSLDAAPDGGVVAADAGQDAPLDAFDSGPDIFDGGPDVFDGGPDVFDAGPFAPLRAITADQYDCNATEWPERHSSVPEDCFTDPMCLDSMVVGHRGSGGGFGLYAPENSLSAIRLAILLGVEAVEIDLRHTADDGLVLMHDSTLDRTTPSDAEVTELTLAELQEIPLNAEGYSGDFSCERIPEFREVLRLARDRVILILDTKTTRGDLVAEALRDEGMLDQAFVSVSGSTRAVSARTAVPEVRIQLRPGDVPEWEAMAGLFSRPPEILEVPESEVLNFLPIAEEIEAKLFVDVFGADAVVLVTGDLPRYNSAFDLGATIVQSEFPFWVLETLGRRDWSTLPPHRDIGLESPLLP